MVFSLFLQGKLPESFIATHCLQFFPPSPLSVQPLWLFSTSIRRLKLLSLKSSMPSLMLDLKDISSSSSSFTSLQCRQHSSWLLLHHSLLFSSNHHDAPLQNSIRVFLLTECRCSLGFSSFLELPPNYVTLRRSFSLSEYMFHLHIISMAPIL